MAEFDSDIEFDGDENLSDVESEWDAVNESGTHNGWEVESRHTESESDEEVNDQLNDELPHQPILFYSKDKKIQYSSEPPPPGRAPFSRVGTISREGKNLFSKNHNFGLHS